jgi:hypothetical protein
LNQISLCHSTLMKMKNNSNNIRLWEDGSESG